MRSQSNAENANAWLLHPVCGISHGSCSLLKMVPLSVFTLPGFRQHNWPEEARDCLSWKDKGCRTNCFHIRSHCVVDPDAQVILIRTQMVSQIEGIRRPDAYPDRFPIDMNLRSTAHTSQIEHSTHSRLIRSARYQGLTIVHPSAVAD